VASAFSLSRGRAAEAIESGAVFVNGLQSEKADRQIKEGDKLLLRGKGKVLLKAVGGVTKKDRISIVIQKYL
jgi:RNA-binding protein YlmH